MPCKGKCVPCKGKGEPWKRQRCTLLRQRCTLYGGDVPCRGKGVPCVRVFLVKETRSSIAPDLSGSDRVDLLTRPVAAARAAVATGASG